MNEAEKNPPNTIATLADLLPGDLCVRLGDGTFSYQEFLDGAHRPASVPAQCREKRGSLNFQGVDICSIELSPDGQNLTIQSRPVSVETIRADAVVELSAEVGRTWLDLGDVAALNSGTVIEVNRHPDEPITLFIAGHAVGTARPVRIDDFYGIRVESLFEMDALAARLNQAGPLEDRIHQASVMATERPGIESRLLFGRTRLRYSELAELHVGQLLALDRIVGLPAEFVLDSGLRLPAEVCTSADFLAARIIGRPLNLLPEIDTGRRIESDDEPEVPVAVSEPGEGRSETDASSPVPDLQLPDEPTVFDAAQLVDPALVAGVLIPELDQLIAFVLVHFTSDRAAEVLRRFPESRQDKILRRMSKIESTRVDIDYEVNRVLIRKLYYRPTSKEHDGRATADEIRAELEKPG